jgi:tetratricopeptide (TPR) repeat protein
LLLHLARRAAGDRILLVGTYRDVEVNRQHPLEAALGELVRERLVEEVSLCGLSPAGTAALIGAHLGLDEVPAAFRDLLQARTEGNPFFIEEVLKALVEQGAIVSSGTGRDRTAVVELDVPRSIRSVVGRRVGRLAPEAQEVLRAASVLGQEWDIDVLLGVTGQDEAAVLDCLDAAFTARLLEERREGRRERYAFAHALIGQALYDEVPGYRLRRLHLRAGEALERMRGERAEAWAELARHFLAAGEEERATRYAIRAGDHAASLYANAEAVQHYEVALDLLAEARDDMGAAPVREKLGTALRFVGRYDTALMVLDRAAETYSTTGNLVGLARVTAQIGRVHQWTGTPEEGIARVQSIMAAVEAGGPSPGLAELWVVLAGLCFVSGRYSELWAASERAMELARVTGDDRLLVEAGVYHSITLVKAGRAEMAGRVVEALGLAEEATRLAVVVGALDSLFGALVVVAYTSTVCGEFGASRGYYQRAVEVAERLSDPHSITFASAIHGWLAFMLGEWDRAQEDSDRAVSVSRQARMPWAAAYALLHRGQLRLAEGKWEEAFHYLEEAVALAGRGGDLQALRQAAGLLAELEILAGRADAAHARLVPLLDRPGLEEYDVTAILPALAWAHLELDEVAQAADIVERALQRTRPENLRLALVDALRVQALVATRQEQWQEAEQAVAEGIALARSMPYPYAQARLLHLSGRLHTQAGKPETARERLATALAIFQRLGARNDIKQVERDLAACATEG